MTDTNRFWRRVVDDHRAQPRELLHSERDLAATPPSALPAPAINQLVQQTCQSAESMRRPRRRRALVASAVLVVLLAPLAWVGARAVLPARRATPFVLDHAAALRISTMRPSEPQHFAAVSRLDDDLVKVANELTRLGLHAPASIAEAANSARADMLAFLTGSEAPGELVAEPRAQLRIAADEQRTVAVRVDAIAAVSASARAAIAALRDARFTDGTREQQRARMVARLQRLLR